MWEGVKQWGWEGGMGEVGTGRQKGDRDELEER